MDKNENWSSVGKVVNTLLALYLRDMVSVVGNTTLVGTSR